VALELTLVRYKVSDRCFKIVLCQAPAPAEAGAPEARVCRRTSIASKVRSYRSRWRVTAGVYRSAERGPDRYRQPASLPPVASPFVLCAVVASEANIDLSGLGETRVGDAPRSRASLSANDTVARAMLQRSRSNADLAALSTRQACELVHRQVAA
jgi:hypothetical protein